MLRCISTIESSGRLLALACLCGWAAQEAVAQTVPATFPMRGTVRDFRRTNTNFAVAPAGGNGLYTGNLQLQLSSSERPSFVGGGHKVLIQWRDQYGRAIAPNMLIDSDGGGTVPVVDPPTIANNPAVDTYDPAAGPYGPDNRGPAPEFVAGSMMPLVSMPSGLGASAGNMLYTGDSVTTLSQNVHCDDFTVRNRHTLLIGAAVTIVCEGRFLVENHTKVELLPGGSLTVYARGGCLFQNNVDVNMNTNDSSRMMIYHMGESELGIDNSVRLCARVVAPTAPVHVHNNSDFFGRFSGESAIIGNSGGFHIEKGVTICGREPNDVAGVYGVLSAGGIPSASAFDTWYSDVPGSNLSAPYTITLRRDNTGTVWQFITSGFHPIDGTLFGNEGHPHNNYFTFAATVRFRHHACQSTFFEFNGNDDAWLFVNGRLAMDRGGILMPAVPQYVEIDRLGLVDGQEYLLHFFYAQRDAVMSVFRLRTNLDLIEQPVTVLATAPAD